MSRLLLMTASLGPSGEVLPALGLLAHHVRVLPAEASALLNAPKADALSSMAAATWPTSAR
jgi:hypothetical protein